MKENNQQQYTIFGEESIDETIGQIIETEKFDSYFLSFALKKTVSSFEKEVIGYKKGWRGKLSRLEIKYETNESNNNDNSNNNSNQINSQTLPPTLVIKVPTSKEQTKLYNLTECKFYERIAPLVAGFYTPKCYFNYLNDSSGNTILIMEDLSNATFYDFKKSCPFDVVSNAVKSLAIFHAQFFEHNELLDPKSHRFGWIRSFLDEKLKEEFHYKWKFYKGILFYDYFNHFLFLFLFNKINLNLNNRLGFKVYKT